MQLRRRLFSLLLSPLCFGVSARADETLVVPVGTTQSFTVDTPEDKGIVATKPDVAALLADLASRPGPTRSYQVVGADGIEKARGEIVAGDRVIATAGDGTRQTLVVELKPLAVPGRLQLKHDTITVNTPRALTLYFTAGQRSPDATVRIFLPAGIEVTPDNTTVNVIGRGEVTLRNLPRQSIGRVGSAYSYSKVGEAALGKSADGGTTLTFSHLDLRPANGADLTLVISGVKVAKAGAYVFRANYAAAQPEILTSAGDGAEATTLHAVTTISDFARVIDRGRRYVETDLTHAEPSFTWTAVPGAVRLEQSSDGGNTWAPAEAVVDAKAGAAHLGGLEPNREYLFRLVVADGPHRGASNRAAFYSGKLDIKSRGVTGDGQADDTDKINEAIAYLAGLGGGTLVFSDGTYHVRTVHLRSNVYLYLNRGATIAALKGADAPEAAWFSDRKYRSGLSPTDAGPYAEPENWLTKQDVGHHYFHNAMFFGERLDNVKIVGNGRITGAGNLVTGDNVMRNAPGNRADKMFTLKLCTNLEIGGITRAQDLWYDEARDEPCYLGPTGEKLPDIETMLRLDRAGHFVLLATGTDGINVHDTYIGRDASGSSRDIYDFMQCNDVAATNIYCKATSDDIVKPGSDCSLGFTRPAKGYRVRNIVGDTNCNLFQIGSETADDITDVHVDNIYVLGGNKAGFSISTNDGAHVKDVHLNCGHTGPLRERSQMRRTHTPFFISISNRGRILGATAARFKFDENGKAHDELLNTNIDIGVVENVILNGVDVSEMYAGSSFRPPRWKPFDGSQPKQAPIVAGYKLPAAADVQGGLNFKLPNGRHTGYVRNVVFNDIHFLAKGGSPKSDMARRPPELGVGQYNASNLGVLPAYGLYARHVVDLTITNCSFNYEKRDSTPVMAFDDVLGAKVEHVKLVRAADQENAIAQRTSRDVSVKDSTVYTDTWGNAPQGL